MLRIIAVALAIAAWQLTGLEEWAWAYTCGLLALLLIVLEYKGAPAPQVKAGAQRKEVAGDGTNRTRRVQSKPVPARLPSHPMSI